MPEPLSLAIPQPDGLTADELRLWREVLEREAGLIARAIARRLIADRERGA